MKLEIKKDKDPVLRADTEEIADFDMDFQHFVDNMVETMRAENGIGLAAPQVGTGKKVITIEFAGDKESKLDPIPLTVLCNPIIVESSKENKIMVEGCLSFPGLEILVKRPKKVTVKGKDRYGNDIKIEADNLFGRIAQHEIDHLNGILLPDHIKPIDVVFIGTGTLGLPALEAIDKDPQYNLKLVITGTIDGTGRRKESIINPIKQLAHQLNANVIETPNIKDPEVLEKIRSLKPALGIMADFGQIVPKELISIPKYGIINIHPSLVPIHRGPSPIQQTILDGDKETGVSLILTTEKMDAGGVIAVATAKLSGSENATILKEYLARGGANLLLNSVPYYIAGDLPPEPQNEAKASYSHLFKKEDGFVDEKTPAVEVERKIRAFSEWPKVYTILNGKRIQLLASHFDPEGNLIIDRVKPEGKREMTYEEFQRGYHLTLTFKR